MPTSFTAQTRCCTVRYCHAVNTSKHVTEMVEGVPEPLRQLCRRQFLLQMLCNIVPASSRALSVTHSLHHLGLYFITYLPHLLFRSCEVPMNEEVRISQRLIRASHSFFRLRRFRPSTRRPAAAPPRSGGRARQQQPARHGCPAERSRRDRPQKFGRHGARFSAGGRS